MHTIISVLLIIGTHCTLIMILCSKYMNMPFQLFTQDKKISTVNGQAINSHLLSIIYKYFMHT